MNSASAASADAFYGNLACISRSNEGNSRQSIGTKGMLGSTLEGQLIRIASELRLPIELSAGAAGSLADEVSARAARTSAATSTAALGESQTSSLRSQTLEVAKECLISSSAISSGAGARYLLAFVGSSIGSALAQQATLPLAAARAFGTLSRRTAKADGWLGEQGYSISDVRVLAFATSVAACEGQARAMMPLMAGAGGRSAASAGGPTAAVAAAAGTDTANNDEKGAAASQVERPPAKRARKAVQEDSAASAPLPPPSTSVPSHTAAGSASGAGNQPQAQVQAQAGAWRTAASAAQAVPMYSAGGEMYVQAIRALGSAAVSVLLEHTHPTPAPSSSSGPSLGGGSGLALPMHKGTGMGRSHMSFLSPVPMGEEKELEGLSDGEGGAGAGAGSTRRARTASPPLPTPPSQEACAAAAQCLYYAARLLADAAAVLAPAAGLSSGLPLHLLQVPGEDEAATSHLQACASSRLTTVVHTRPRALQASDLLALLSGLAKPAAVASGQPHIPSLPLQDVLRLVVKATEKCPPDHPPQKREEVLRAAVQLRDGLHRMNAAAKMLLQ